MLKRIIISLSLVLSLCATPIYASDISSEVLTENESYLEYEIAIGDVDIEIYEGDIEQISRGTLNYFNWSVGINAMVQTPSFTANSGQTISISSSFAPTNQNVNIGIIEPDGTMRYLLRSGSAAHTFSLDQTGSYRVFVRNRGTATVTASGYYSVN